MSLMIGFGAQSGIATLHPPLGESIDQSKCITCHANVTKGTYVHPAMQKGCLTCHEFRVYNGTTRVKLVTNSALDLCLNCHGDLNAAHIKGQVHSPAVRQCLVCHDPHSSANKGLLVEPTVGPDAKSNLCLTCHTTGMEVPPGGSRHQALDKGCEVCHSIHKSGDPSKREFAAHLAKDEPQMCFDCHSPTDPGMIKAHPDRQLDKADCLACHDPHVSKFPHLLSASIAAPVVPAVAQLVHEHPYIDPKDNKSETCIKCHPNDRTGKFVHTAVTTGCDNCHTATSEKGKTTLTLVATGGDLCAMCHEAVKDSVLHGPYKDGQCLVCHDPHTSDYAKQLRAPVNALCLECHGPDSNRQDMPKEHLVAMFDGKVKLPESYFNQVPVLPLQHGIGHPVDNHPISDVVLPKTKATFAMNCLTCHQPHGGNAPNMLVKDQENNMKFCETCHVNPLDLSQVKMGGK